MCLYIILTILYWILGCGQITLYVLVELRCHWPLFFSSTLITGFCLQKCRNFVGQRGVCCNRLPVQQWPPACAWKPLRRVPAFLSLTVPWVRWGSRMVRCHCLTDLLFVYVTTFWVWFFFFNCWSSNHALRTNTASKEIKSCWIFCVR